MKVKYVFRTPFRSPKHKFVFGQTYDIDKAVIDMMPDRFEILTEKPKKDVNDGEPKQQ